MVNGVAGTLQQDGTVLWADGTVWSAGTATLTTTTTVDPNAGGVAPTDAYGGSMGGSQSGVGIVRDSHSQKKFSYGRVLRKFFRGRP